MVIAVVVIELIACLAASVLIQLAFPLEAWFACAILQLTIRYLPPDRRARYRLWIIVALIFFVSFTSGGIGLFPHLHQVLFIAGVASLPQLWWEWFAKTPESRALGLGLICLISLPLGSVTWSLANIGIVKFEAWRVSHGEPYCILVSDGRIFSSGYHQAPDNWSLSGWRMISGRGAGGSGNCCQWDFHALLVTHNDQFFNWSYRSQRFESLSERSAYRLAFRAPKCKDMAALN